MKHNVSRRDFIKTVAVTTGAVTLSGCSFPKQVLGICETRLPQDPTSWKVAGDMIEVELSRMPELSQKGSAVRLESDELPVRVLVVCGQNENFYAFKNKCTHYSNGRRIDPVPGTLQLRCCSVGQATFDYGGNVLAGPAKGPLTRYPVAIKENKLLISLQS